MRETGRDYGGSGACRNTHHSARPTAARVLPGELLYCGAAAPDFSVYAVKKFWALS